MGSACNVGELGLIPGSGRSPREGNGNPLQYLCLENPMDEGDWQVTVHGVANSWTRLSSFTIALLDLGAAELTVFSTETKGQSCHSRRNYMTSNL